MLLYCITLSSSRENQRSDQEVGVAVFSFLLTGRCMYVYMLRARLYYDTCVHLHPPVYMYIHVRDQNDNATYASTWWVPTVRHFLACKDVAGGSQQSWGKRFFREILVARPMGPCCQVEE